MSLKYIFKPYSKKFPNLFAKEKVRVACLINTASLIEHVGSTAVPNLGGKGIIDIAIGATPQETQIISEQLQILGYEFRPAHSTPDRLFFRIDLPDQDEGTRRYHVHLMPTNSQELKEMLLFRDYLRNHPDEAEKYAALKRNAAAESNQDGPKYRALKKPLIEGVLNKKVHEH